MTEQELAWVKSNMMSLLDVQLHASQTKLNLLEERGEEILETTDKAVIEKETNRVKQRYSVLKQFKSQTEASNTAEELKAIHDKLAQFLNIKLR